MSVAKYDRLGKHLSGLDRARKHRLGFDRIEAILGFALPRSARSHQAWWANQKNGRHVQANAWLDEGWVTEDLSLSDRQVTFAPSDLPRSLRTVEKPGYSIDAAKRGVALRYGVRPNQVDITIRA
jgi:hypothetical protein